MTVAAFPSPKRRPPTRTGRHLDHDHRASGDVVDFNLIRLAAALHRLGMGIGAKVGSPAEFLCILHGGRR